MELSKQVASLELSKKLKALGVKQESAFSWVGPDEYVQLQKVSADSIRVDIEKCAAFTVAELGLLLGDRMQSGFNEGRGFFCDWRGNDKVEQQWAETEADCRAFMLIHLLETGIIKGDL
jgi:hypothetical protein